MIAFDAEMRLGDARFSCGGVLDVRVTLGSVSGDALSVVSVRFSSLEVKAEDAAPYPRHANLRDLEKKLADTVCAEYEMLLPLASVPPPHPLPDEYHANLVTFLRLKRVLSDDFKKAVADRLSPPMTEETERR